MIMPARRSVEQLRGIEARVKRTHYQLLAQKYGVKWTSRAYNPELGRLPTCPTAVCRPLPLRSTA